MDRNDDISERERLLFDRMFEEMPGFASPSTVAILAYYDGFPRLHATGTLFRLADHYFLVTASHAIQHYLEARKHYSDIALFIDNGQSEQPIPLEGSYLATEEVRESNKDTGGKDAWDIAVWELSQETVKGLTHKKFINRSHIQLKTDFTKGVYFLLGFPCQWSNPDFEQKTVHISSLHYIAHPHSEPQQILNYDPEWHIALFLKRDSPMPDNMKGISGSSIWKLSGDPIPDDWSANDAKIIGMQTCIDSRCDGLRGTKWNAVARVLLSYRPEFKKLFDSMWFPPKKLSF